ncbi:hypothetical protein V6N11_061757 [Hibiscus sabdariffa]|uniref:Uncharacterized protein n=2 Tax=Hibiscus sabdariffa TaxID=183260 RepID=A0ABR2ABM7_9ROSI
MTILVSTNLPKRIDEYVELEVNNCIYFISVVEKGFTDNSTGVEGALGRKEGKVSTMHSSGSQSDSTSETNRRQTQDVDVGSKLQSVDEAISAVFLGKGKNVDCSTSELNSNRILGECELLGNNDIDGNEASCVSFVKKDTSTLNLKDGLTINNMDGKLSWVDVVTKGQNIGLENGDGHRALDYFQSIGLGFSNDVVTIDEPVGSFSNKSSWEADVDAQNCKGVLRGVQIMTKGPNLLRLIWMRR